MPPRPPKHPVVIAPEYLAELRARVEAIGMSAVADAAGLARQTLWRQLAGGNGRKANADGVERIRRALAKLDPDATPMPPPIVAVRGLAHHGWIELAASLDPEQLTRAVADPSRVLAAAKMRPRRK